MPETLVLVPIRFPLEEPGVRTLRRAVDLAADHEDAHQYVVHVNLLHRDERVDRDDLETAVTRAFGPLPNASYHVRNGFLHEEAILYEAVQLDADYVVIGRDTRARWRQLLSDRLDIDGDLEGFLREHPGARLVWCDTASPPRFPTVARQVTRCAGPRF